MPATDEWQAALAAFAAWARRQPRAPRDPASLVTDVVVTHEPVGLLSTDMQGRRVVWKSVPADARARIGLPAVDLHTVDAWSADPATLRARSDHIAICDVCTGQRTVECDVCVGGGTLRCHTCKGQRKMHGYASNGSYRLLNCTTCRGKGELDCGSCRRGIATCTHCSGQGRLQRWLELEWWSRSVVHAHPAAAAQQLGWSGDPSLETLRRDAEVAVNVERPHRLSSADIGHVPAQWLEMLAPQLQPAERVMRQRLRIAEVPASSVEYRVGGEVDRVVFRGRRLLAPNDVTHVLARRGARLGRLLSVLLVIGALLALAALARGAFYWSWPALLSLVAAAGALGALYLAAADWTGSRRHPHRWLAGFLTMLVAALALNFAALPRAGHAAKLIAAGDLDRAEAELSALGEPGTGAWADLRLARLRGTRDVTVAREALALIPRGLPQQAAGAAAVDQLILSQAEENVRGRHWFAALEGLALLSEDQRRQPRSVAAAKSALLPLAQERVAKSDWSGAANAIGRARGIGVAADDLQAAATPLHDAAMKAIAAGRRERDPGARLRLRIEAEKLLVMWERATGNWGTAPLIALRTSMASDVATLEKTARRRGAS